MRKKGQRKKARKGIGCGKIGRQAEIEEKRRDAFPSWLEQLLRSEALFIFTIQCGS